MTAPRPAVSSPAWTLACLSLSALLPSLGVSIANVALPELAEAFDASFRSVQWVVLAYLLAVTTLIVGVGRLGDLVGRRRLMLAGIALFGFASLAGGMAPSLPLLFAARAAQGLGAAVMMALGMAFVGEAVPKARTGSAMGLLGTMSATGTALGPSLGGVLMAWTGWQAIFLVGVPPSAAAFALAWRYLPRDAAREGERQRFDHLGTWLLAAALAAYALAMTIGRGRFGLLNVVLLLVALLGMALFALAESRVRFPLVRPAMLRDPALAAGLVANGLVSTVMMTTLVVGPFYLTRGLGLDTASVGLALSAGPVVSALSGVPSGRIVDRFGAARMTAAGLAAMALGALLLSMVAQRFGVAGYIAPIVATTAGYALFQAANNTAVMADVAPDRRGVVSAMLNLSRNLGLVTGASLMGAVFAFGAGNVEVASAGADAVRGGMHVTFALAAGLIAVALAISGAGVLAARRRRVGDAARVDRAAVSH